MGSCSDPHYVKHNCLQIENICNGEDLMNHMQYVDWAEIWVSNETISLELV